MDSMPNNEFSERGYFWWSSTIVPKGNFAPIKGAHGNLTISAEGVIELELDTALTEQPAQMLDAHRTIEKQICGLLKSDSRRVYLGKLSILKSAMRSGTFSHEKYGAQFCLLYHDRSEVLNDVKFIDKMEINLLGFDQWFGSGSISVKSTKRQVVVKHKKEKEKIYNIDNGKLRLSFSLAKPHDWNHNTEVNLKEINTLLCEKKFESLDSVLDEYLRIEEFFIVLTNRERTLTWPIIQVNHEKIRAKLYFRRISLLTQEITFHNSWTTYRDINDTFGALFDSWKTKYKAFGPGFYYYISLRKGLKLYSEHRFMNSVWGLESLHRRLHGDMKNTKIEQKVARILGKIDTQRDKKWLERQLRFCAEPSLKDRIYELFAPLPLHLDEELLKAFAEKCADYRNDLSHFGTARKDLPYLKFIEHLHVLGSALELLYHFKIFAEIGIPNEHIEWLVTNGFESYAMKGILWDAGLLKSDPQAEAQEAAMASVEATRKRLTGTASANNDVSPE